MTIKKHNALIELDVVPEFHSTVPSIICGIDDQLENKIIDKPTTLTFDLALDQGPHRLIVELIDKTNADTIPHLNLDKTITIKDLRIYGISFTPFLWQATYTPIYPEPWYSQQDPTPPAKHFGTTTLGWNGRWQLDFTSPVFTWVHQTEKMGWIWPI